MNELKTQLLIIDPQVDFCDGPYQGALAVPGADEDMKRLAAFIDQEPTLLDDITVTLDSHHLVDIGHPAYWRTADGEMPAPFTLVTSEDLRTGRLVPADAKLLLDAHGYLERLAVRGRYVHTIWPPHCLIGSPGHAVHPALMEALNAWSVRHSRQINFVLKGLNPHTEHYSAIKAEVPDQSDPLTCENMDLVRRLAKAERIYVAGEALSHCVKSTVEDLVDAAELLSFGGRNGLAPKLTLFSDAMSPVPAVPGGPDFPAIGKAFLDEMAAKGATIGEIGI